MQFVPLGPVGANSRWRGVWSTNCEALISALPTCDGIILACSVPGQRADPPLTMRVYALVTALRALDEHACAVPIVYYDADPVLVSRESINEWCPDADLPIPPLPESVPQWLARVAPEFSVIDMTGSRASFQEVLAAAGIAGSNAVPL